MIVPEIEVTELAAERTRRSWCILDVREDWELDIASIEGCQHIPLLSLLDRLTEVPTDQPIAVLCHSGIRSASATQLLLQSGRKEVYNVRGGIDQWSVDVDPETPRY